MSASHNLQRFFESNRLWSEAVTARDREFFPTSALDQKPTILWLGCADSRVPESVLLAVKPGEVFVHRNIANQFHLHDESALSVLTFAVQALGVKHVVVVGHTHCGGIKGAFDAASSNNSNAQSTPLTRWLTPLANLAKEHNLPAAGHETGIPKLTQESIRTQVANVASTSVIKDAWASGNKVSIHGWLYRLETGRLEDLGFDVYAPEDARSTADE